MGIGVTGVFRGRIICCIVTSILLLLINTGCSVSEVNSVYLYSEQDTIIKNSDEEMLVIQDGHFDGKLKPIEIVSQTEFGSMLRVPYSDNFIFDGDCVERVKYSVLTDLDLSIGDSYTASGTGVKKVTINPLGEIILDGDSFSFEVSGTMRYSLLGKYGVVRLFGIAEEPVEIRFDEEAGNVIFYGANSEFLFISINGDMRVDYVPIPSFGNGIIGLDNLDEDIITITDEDGVIQRIPVKTHSEHVIK